MECGDGHGNVTQTRKTIPEIRVTTNVRPRDCLLSNTIVILVAPDRWPPRAHQSIRAGPRSDVGVCVHHVAKRAPPAEGTPEICEWMPRVERPVAGRRREVPYPVPKELIRRLVGQ